MNKDTLAALIERVEQATGPDRVTDVAIARAVGVDLGHAAGMSDEMLAAAYGPVRRYTASLDAAVSLYPGKPPLVIPSDPRLVVLDALRAKMESER